MMTTRIGRYLIGLGIFSAVDAERRPELPSQYTAPRFVSREPTPPPQA
jgi:hypothetical protein